jgi:hypothetical protein
MLLVEWTQYPIYNMEFKFKSYPTCYIYVQDFLWVNKQIHFWICTYQSISVQCSFNGRHCDSMLNLISNFVTYPWMSCEWEMIKDFEKNYINKRNFGQVNLKVKGRCLSMMKKKDSHSMLNSELLYQKYFVDFIKLYHFKTTHLFFTPMV